VIFFDASAAAKRYFREIGSDLVNELWRGPEFFSSLTILHCGLPQPSIESFARGLCLLELTTLSRNRSGGIW